MDPTEAANLFQDIFVQNMGSFFQSTLNILFSLFLSQEFWNATGSIASLITSLTVLIALYYFKKNKQLSKVQFINAIDVDIGLDGVYSIFNNSDEAIKIYMIKQSLITGSSLGLSKNASSSQVIKKINVTSEIHFAQTQFERIRWLLPGKSFIFGDTLTHLPTGYDEESIWIVISEIYYLSQGKRKGSYKISHRFSKVLEPRLRWIELGNWIVGKTTIISP